MAAPRYELDLATHIQNQGLGVLGTGLFYAPEMPAIPVDLRATFVIPYAGPAPEDRFATAGGNSKLWKGRCQVRHRVPIQDFQQGLAESRALLRACHLATVPDSENGTYYVKVFALASDPFYHGPNGNDQLVWSFNVEMWADEAV